MEYKISKSEICKLIKKGYDLDTISFEFEVPLETLEEYKKEISKENEASKTIKELVKLKKYSEAKEIGENFKDSVQIQSQMIKIAMQEGDVQTLNDIAKRLENSKIIQTQINKVLHKGQQDEDIEKTEINKQIEDSNSVDKQIEDDETKNIELLDRIKTKMYYGIEKIDIQEILQDEQLTEKQKLYTILAIYEKEKNIKGLKELTKQYKDNTESKDINIVLQRAQSKKKQIFNWEFYDNILGWKLDKKLKDEYEQKIKEQEANKKKIREEEKIQQEIREKEKQRERKIENNRRKQIVKGKIKFLKEESTNKVNLPNSQIQHGENNIFKQELKVQVQQELVKINQQNEEKQQKHIYTEVIEFLMEKRKPIYVKMQSTDFKTQREGISQWDKLDDLIEKTNELKDNQDYMNSIYDRVIKLKEKEENQFRR